MAIFFLPASNPLDGTLLLEEELISTRFSKITQGAALIAATALYPVTLAVSTIALIFFSFGYFFYKDKVQKAEGKMQKLQVCSDGQIQELANKRITKLQGRMLSMEKRYAELYLKHLNLPVNHLNKEIEQNVIRDVKNGYRKAESFWERLSWKEALLTVSAYERASQEIDALNAARGQLGNVRELFRSKYGLAKVRHEIKVHVAAHCLYNLYIAALPFVGVLCVLQAQYSIKNSLENAGMIDRYKQEMGNNNWLKPY